jgi:uncharacterized membrane protein YphA (DoxX/SURF4 family)
MFNKENIFRTVNLGLRIYLGGVFLFACYHKILHPGEFALSVASYQLLPLALINFFAVTLPWVELFSGLGIILGFRPRENSLIIIGMMLIFIFVIGSALSRDLAMGCGCFASTEAAEEISIATLARDVIWLIIAVYLFFVEDGKWGLGNLIQRRFKHAA